MPTYEIQRVRTFRMNETLVISAASPEDAALTARIRPTPLDVRKLTEDKNGLYLVRITEVNPS